MRVYTFISSILFTLVFSNNTYSSPNQTTLNFGQTSSGAHYLCAHKALNASYAQLGYQIEYTTLPNRRTLVLSNTGDLDGEMLRVEGLEKDYPNLIQIPVPLCITQTIFVAHDYVEVDTIEDLKKYKLGITAGFVMQEKLIKRNKLNAVSAIEKKNLLKVFRMGRIDIILLADKEVNELLASKNGSKYKVIEKLSLDGYLYHYLHKKHKALAPQITGILKTMENKGLIDYHLKTQSK